MPWGLYEAIAEALEVMADKDLMANLRQSILEMETGEALCEIGTCQVTWRIVVTPTAIRMLSDISDRRIREGILEAVTSQLPCFPKTSM
jgi:hypothetical protein